MAESESPPPSFGKKTFAEILSSASLGKSIQAATPVVDKPKIGLLKGKPSVSLSKQLVLDLSAPFKRSLVGKFSQGRPMLEDIHSYLVSLDLKGQFQIGILDARHIIINFQNDDDYHKIYSRMIWYIGDSVMRIFKWTTNFHVDKESPIVPIWIELEKLPIFLFQKDVLFAIASTIGIPLRLDAATAALRKPSVARIQVEINLMKERPDSIWVGLGDEEGFWQKIKYCNVPSYCSFCWHVGHALDYCHIKNPSLKQVNPESAEIAKETESKKRSFVYRIKEKKDNVGAVQVVLANESIVPQMTDSTHNDLDQSQKQADKNSLPQNEYPDVQLLPVENSFLAPQDLNEQEAAFKKNSPQMTPDISLLTIPADKAQASK